MAKPSELTRSLQEFSDILRALQWESLTDEERATMRAVLVELKWLVEHSEEQPARGI